MDIEKKKLHPFLWAILTARKQNGKIIVNIEEKLIMSSI